MRQLMSRTRSQDEGHCPSEAIGAHAGFGPISTPKAPQRFPCVSLSVRAPQRESPLSSGTRRLLMRPDAGAVEKRHPELHTVLLGQPKKVLPHAQTRPADEGLSRT